MARGSGDAAAVAAGSAGPSPEELFEQKMRSLTRSVIKAGKLKTRRRVGQRQRKRDKLLNRSMWGNVSVFIDNEKIVVSDLESNGARTEIMLSAIKHVLPVGDAPEFAVTWTARVKDAAAVSSPVKQKEAEDGEFSFGFGGDSDEDDFDDDGDAPVVMRDESMVFRAASLEEAREWITALNRAIQVSQSTQLKSTYTQLREYNTLTPGEGEEAVVELQRQNSSAGRQTGRKKRSKLNEAEQLWARANRDARRLPRPMQSAGRTALALAAGLSVTMVGGFFKTLLKAAVAPSTLKRASAEVFQSAWVDVVAWLLPPMLFHLSGDVPKPVRRTSVLSKSKKRSSSSRRRSMPKEQVTRVLVLNSCCQADLVFLMLVAKALEGSQGNVKGFISYKERNQLLGLGSVFDVFGFLPLLRRSSEERQAKDAKAIAKHIRGVHADRAYEWAVIFPERGWPSQAAVLEEAVEAEAAGREPLDMLLRPDPNELAATLKALDGKKCEVYDVTLSYEGLPDTLPATEKEYETKGANTQLPSYANLLNGTAASDIHINMAKFSRDDVVFHDGGVQGWLDERWERKDRLLKHFATYNAFPPDEGQEGMERDAFSVEGSIVPMLFVWLFNLAAFGFIFVYLF